MRRVIVVAVLLVGIAATVWVSFGSAAGKTARKSSSGTSVTISNESGTTWTCGFNPFNPSVNTLAFGPVYEELVFVDTLKNASTTSWLASGYSWSNHNKTLTFTIRSGVKWHDGKPFTASDVVFTFKLLKSHAALDLNSVWSVLSGVSQKGNKVVFTFKKSAVPYFFYIADQTPIVPKHIWSSVKNPVTYNDSTPVGTGPFKMGKCSPQVIKYTKNSSYWQKGLPKLSTIYYPSFTSNDPANLELANDKAQWGSQFIPNIKQFYVSKSPDHHYWFAPIANVSMFINLKDPVLSQLPVREAMAYAIDRSKVSQIGEYAYEPPSNQTGIVTPTFGSWLSSSLAKQYGYDPAKAISILKKAGYKKSGGVFHTPSGKALSFRIINIGGYSDWVAAVQVIESDLKAVGIKITPENLSSTTFQADLFNGKYQLGYDSETGGPSPYYELRQILYSKNSAPIGSAAASNWERYSNPATDALINQFGATTSAAMQHSIVNQLEAVMVHDVPIIPITEEVDWYQYNTKDITGWVTQGDPYAQPAAYAVPDWGVMALHLKPKH